MVAAVRAVRAQSSRIVTAFFDSPGHAESAYQMAASRGYGKEDLSVLMSNDTRDNWLSLSYVTNNPRMSIAAFTIPGGNLAASGSIAMAIPGASLDDSMASLIWLLVERGVPYRRARAYASALEKGGVVLEICPRNDDDVEYLTHAWQACGGREIHYHS